MLWCPMVDSVSLHIGRSCCAWAGLLLLSGLRPALLSFLAVQAGYFEVDLETICSSCARPAVDPAVDT